MKKVMSLVLLLSCWPTLLQAQLVLTQIKEVQPSYLTEA